MERIFMGLPLDTFLSARGLSYTLVYHLEQQYRRRNRSVERLSLTRHRDMHAGISQ
jgi:hypothetical protein